MIEGRGPLDHRLRYLAGLDAEKARLDIKTMALEGHEPLWSMGDDTPTAGRGRLDRPVADHLRQAFAQVTNPAIDPERERVVMDLRVELGRRPALLGGPPRGPRTLRLERPIVADLDGLLEVALAGGRRVRVLDATWPARTARSGLGRRLDAARARGRRGERGGHRGPARQRRVDLDRSPAGAVDPRGRGRAHRPDRRRPAWPDGPRGRRGRRPRRPRDGDDPRRRRHGRPSAARARARGRARRVARCRGRSRRRARSRTSSTRSPPACARPWRGWASARSPSYIGGVAHRHGRPGAGRRSRAASRRPRRGPAGRRSTTSGRASSVAAMRRWRSRHPSPAARRDSPTRVSRGSAPTVRPTSSRRGSRARSRCCRARRRRSRASRHRTTRSSDIGPRCRGRPPRHRRLATSCGYVDSALPVTVDSVEDARSIAHRFVVSAMSVGALSPGGAPGADDRHPACRWCGEHRRGRRGSGVVRRGTRRSTPRRPDQAGRLGAVRGDRHVPRAGRPARDQDRPGLEARRGRPAARSQGDRVHRGVAPRAGRAELHQPAAAPRHLLDRGPRAAHRRPAGDQSRARGSA